MNGWMDRWFGDIINWSVQVPHLSYLIIGEIMFSLLPQIISLQYVIQCEQSPAKMVLWNGRRTSSTEAVAVETGMIRLDLVGSYPRS